MEGEGCDDDTVSDSAASMMMRHSETACESRAIEIQYRSSHHSESNFELLTVSDSEVSRQVF